MRLGALFLLVILAGCSAPAEPPEARATERAPTEDALARLDLVRPEPVAAAGALDVAVSLSERWLKPFGAFDASAQAPAGAAVAWFVELEEVEPRATVVRGEVYVLKSTTPDRNDHDGPRAPVRVSDLAPDGRARALKLVTPGRYTLVAEGAMLTLNVWPGAPAGGGQAFLVESAGRLRFEPAELDAAPGARVLLWNQAGRTADVVEASFAAYVPIAPSGGRVTPIDEGLYRLMALAVAPDGRARGLASEAFLVDFERPSQRLGAGPFVGEHTLAPLGVEEPHRVGFRADHPLRSLVVSFEAGSNAPAPASVHVSLYHEGAALANASSLTASEIALSDLPAGQYALEIRGEHGALVRYEVSAEGVYRLPMPERLREATR